MCIEIFFVIGFCGYWLISSIERYEKYRNLQKTYEDYIKFIIGGLVDTLKMCLMGYGAWLVIYQLSIAYGEPKKFTGQFVIYR
jgi:hypothetical protein